MAEDDALDGMMLFGEERVNHGQPGSSVTFDLSFTHRVTLRVPRGSPTDLMAHHVWQSGVTFGEALLAGRLPLEVRGKRVLELGCGAALPSIACLLAGASFVYTTDYPDEHILTNARENLQGNRGAAYAEASYSVAPLLWGAPAVETIFRDIDVVVAADTLWITKGHEDQISTILRILTHGPPAALVCFAYLDHDNDGAVTASFFQQCRDRGLKLVHEESIDWRKDKDGDVDKSEYGDVHVKIMSL